MPEVPIPQAQLREGFQVTKPMVVGGIGVIAMMLAAIGSVLPWATVSAMVFSVSKGGLSGDGIITIILSVLGLGLFAIGITGKARWAFISGLILSAIILGVSIYDAVDITKLASGAQAGASITVGVGLVLCIIGGVIGVGAGVGGIK